jgi:hypothetical protein
MDSGWQPAVSDRPVSGLLYSFRTGYNIAHKGNLLRKIFSKVEGKKQQKLPNKPRWE